jgi:hypothetical protein
MTSQRRKPLIIAAAVIVGVWLLAWAGYTLAQNAKVTAEKVRTELKSLQLAKLAAAERAKALRKLADMLNALPADERRVARLDAEWRRLFLEMTDAEKAEFLEQTLPTGFQQMLSSFEKLQPEQRKKAVGDAMRRLKEAQENPDNRLAGGAPPGMTEDMQKRATAIGMNAFYTQSSAQAKAELAPLLEEIQRSMENGRLFRGRPPQ